MSCHQNPQCEQKQSTMSTKHHKLSEAAASMNVEDDNDIGALIYRESQLRKREAAAVAVAKKCRKNSSASKHRGASTRRAVATDIQSDDSPHLLRLMI